MDTQKRRKILKKKKCRATGFSALSTRQSPGIRGWPTKLSTPSSKLRPCCASALESRVFRQINSGRRWLLVHSRHKLIRLKNPRRATKSGDTQKRARRADASPRVPAASLNLSRYNYGLPRDCARARVDNLASLAFFGARYSSVRSNFLAIASGIVEIAMCAAPLVVDNLTFLLYRSRRSPFGLDRPFV